MAETKKPRHPAKARAADERNLRFVEAYLAKGENGTQAYLQIKPEVTYNTAAVEASRLLKNPKVIKAVEKRRAEIRARFGLTTDRVMHELGRVAYFNPRNLVDHKTGKTIPLHKLDEDTAAGLASIETVETSVSGKGASKVTTRKVTKARPYNKVSALEKSIKILRLYEKPPPLTPEEITAESEIDQRQLARRVAFMLAKEDAAVAKDQVKATPKKATA